MKIDYILEGQKGQLKSYQQSYQSRDLLLLHFQHVMHLCLIRVSCVGFVLLMIGSQHQILQARLIYGFPKMVNWLPCKLTVTDDGVQTRAHLEAQLAFALGIASVFCHIICFLAREADESRLREVCKNFLGPPTRMAKATTSDATNSAWDPWTEEA